jgi:hypothetical protein
VILVVHLDNAEQGGWCECEVEEKRSEYSYLQIVVRMGARTFLDEKDR